MREVQGLSILIVDDNDKKRSGIVRLAEQAGFARICEAASREDAFRLIEMEEFDVAVVDIMLTPRGDDKEGLQVIARVHVKNDRCKIIGLTNKASRDIGAEVVGAGAVDFICGDWIHINYLLLLGYRLGLWKSIVARERNRETVAVGA